MRRSRLQRALGGREIFVVWGLFGIVAVEILVTYSRLPARELYNVTGSGIAGGASRVLVFLNFPAALVALAVLPIVFERLPPAGRAAAIAAGLLCATVLWPGVVDQADLDARWVNVPAAVGVGLAVLLAFRAARVTSATERGDGWRLVLAVVALLAAPAWVAADLGFFLDGVPLLGRIYETGRRMPEQAGLPPFPPAVHHGHHHGMDGVLLVLSALLLSRTLPVIRTRILRVVTAAYLALMLAYGFGNIANDVWLEQVAKRHWTRRTVPSVLEPRATWAWAVVVVVAAAAFAAFLRAGRDARTSTV
jgi:hypothetical protein